MKYNKEIRDVAQALLDERIHIVSGARQISKLLAEMNPSDRPELDLFRAIDSETDHLILKEVAFPISDGRRLSNQKELEEVAEFYASEVKAVCREILEHGK